MIRKHICRLLMIAAAGLAITSAQAQDYPSRVVKIIVPFGAGGITDLYARMLAERLQPILGQTVVVENRPGQGGSLGPIGVARAEPDGHTLLLGGVGNVIGETLYQKNLTYSILTDFTPIVRSAAIVNILFVNPKVKANSVQELIALAKAQPGKLTYASSGHGGVYHLAMEMFKSMSGTNILHVPYRTEPAGRTDVITGVADMMITAYGVAASGLEAKQIRVLAVTSPKRFALLRDVPTIAESGLPGYDGDAWIGLLAPAGTPAAIVDRINREVTRIQAEPEFAAKLAQAGLAAIEETPAEFGAVLRSDVERWKKVIAAAGTKVN